jgi:hypothetical protein
MKLTKLTPLIIIFIFFISFIYAPSPFIQNTEVLQSYITVEYPLFAYYDYNKNIKLNFHIYNSTGTLLDNSTTACLFHLYNNSQEHVIESPLYYGTNNIDFYMNLSKNLFKLNHAYQYIVDCRSTNFGGFAVSGFKIVSDVSNVKDESTIFEKNPLYIIIGFIIVILFYMVLGFTNFKIKQVPAMRLGLFAYGIAFIELLLCIGFIYASELGLDYILLLQINFFSILLITFGFGVISIIINYLAIADLSKSELEEKTWNKKEW